MGVDSVKNFRTRVRPEAETSLVGLDASSLGVTDEASMVPREAVNAVNILSERVKDFKSSAIKVG